MANRRKSLPPVSPKVDPQMRPLLDAFKEIVETGEGIRGNPLDRKLTLRDLIDSGIARLGRGGAGGGGGLIPGDNTPPPNLATPPAPTGFEVDGALGFIFLSWDTPREAYSNHGYTEIWRHTADNLANATLHGQAFGSMFPDMNTLFGTTYYYWVRFISSDNVEGPFNSSAGTPGTESEDPQALLDRLNGEITETELYTDLNSRINLIDADGTGLVTKVNDLEIVYGDTITAAQAASDAIDAQAAAELAAGNADAARILSEEAQAIATSASEAAATSETLTSGYKNDAESAATAAQSSATSAATDAADASTSAGQASTARQGAESAEATAGTYATNAAQSATDAGGAATAASGSASTAATEATNAGNSASAAQTAQVAAESARDDASGHAGAAATSATTASTSASNAGTFADAAEQSALNAETAESQALVYSGQAASSATDAEGFATASAQDYSAISARVNAFPVLQNPGFETGDDTGWTIFSGGVDNVGSGAHRGSHVLVLDNGPGGPNAFSDFKPTGPGEKLMIEAWAKPSPGAAPDSDQSLRVRFYDASNSQLQAITLATADRTDSGWQFLRGTADAPAGSASFRIDLGEAIGAGQWWWDDVDYSKIANDDDITAATITVVDEVIANSNGASASSLAQLSSQHGGNTAAIQVQQDSIDGLEASYTVKIDVNGQVAGYGLSVTGNDYDDTVDSLMLFSVDTFAIGSPGADELSFIVDNGRVVMDAAFIVNLAVTDADIVSVSVGKINGLDASFIEAEIENLSVDKISGDVNSTIEAPVVSGLDLPNVSGEAYREAVALSIPSQTRPRIPLLFSKAVHSAGSTGNYLTKYKVLIRSSVGSYTSVATPDFITADQMRWETVSTSSSPMSNPAGWSSIGTGDEIGRSSSGVWHYSRVLSANYTIASASGGNYIHRWLVLFEWTLSRGVYSNATGGSYRVRSGSSRLYQDVVSEGQNISSLTANDETEVNSYVLSLPRSASSQQYVMAILGNGTLEQLQFTALLVR